MYNVIFVRNSQPYTVRLESYAKVLKLKRGLARAGIRVMDIVVKF